MAATASTAAGGAAAATTTTTTTATTGEQLPAVPAGPLPQWQTPSDPLRATDMTQWHLEVTEGRQVWSYMAEQQAQYVQTFVEKYLLGQAAAVAAEAPATAAPRSVLEAAGKGADFYGRLQTDDGHWANDYGGPLFLMPGLLITSYIAQVDLGEAKMREMVRYLFSLQRADGGWGLHIEDHSTIFGTALSYVSLRLLGVAAAEPRLVRARAFLHANGGATGIPSWGKFWLATLGVYEWTGLNPIPPELWLLPDWVPFHPGRWWCHCRVVYLPMGYVYGTRATGPRTPLVDALRTELYTQPYGDIDWPAQRNNVSSLDTFKQHTRFLNFIMAVLAAYERIHSGALRRRALALTLDHIRSEDRNTKWICIGPVNKAINMLSIFFAEGRDSDNFKRHAERIHDYLWVAADGCKMQGYNGSQLWDSAFALQALTEHRAVADRVPDVLRRGHHYLDVCQVREDVPEMPRYYRHISKGAWPFSTRDHGWPISDCTAEGVKAELRLRQLPCVREPLADQRMFDAVNVMLSMQNRDSGGWATYELKRGPNWVELFNPAECFEGIMVDYPYVECTSACCQALLAFQRFFPHHRTDEIRAAVRGGIRFITGIQRPDGSWYGSWGVCFTYGTWFGVEALLAVGGAEHAPAIRRACEFLLAKQKADGSWGETFQSCVRHEWSEHPEGQVVNTAWAALTLLAAGWDREPIRRAVDWLVQKQLPNGDWAQESISGVFNGNCAISYSAYKNIFPIWALSRYAKAYPDSKL